MKRTASFAAPTGRAGRWKASNRRASGPDSVAASPPEVVLRSLQGGEVSDPALRHLSKKFLLARTTRVVVVPSVIGDPHECRGRRSRPRGVPQLPSPAGAGRARPALAGQTRPVGHRPADVAGGAQGPRCLSWPGPGGPAGLAAPGAGAQPGQRPARLPPCPPRRGSRAGPGRPGGGVIGTSRGVAGGGRLVAQRRAAAPGRGGPAGGGAGETARGAARGRHAAAPARLVGARDLPAPRPLAGGRRRAAAPRPGAAARRVATGG